MAYNNKYDYFAQIMSQNISDSDIRRLTTRFDRETYTEDPKKMLTELDKLFDEKWEEHYKKRLESNPAIGNLDPSVTKNNFKKYLQKTLKLDKNKKLIFDSPTRLKRDSSGDIITDQKGNPIWIPKVAGAFDFRPLYQQYQEAVGELKKRPKILPRIQDIVQITKGEKKPTYFNPSRFIGRIENQIRNAENANHVDELLAMRDAMQNLAFQPERARPISSIEAARLYTQANDALSKFQRLGRTQRFAMKTPDELKIALALEGIDITRLRTNKQIQNAAKKADIGLRRYQRSKKEFINAIINTSKGYDEKALQSKSSKDVKDIWDSIQKGTQPPEGSAFIWQKDLPTKREQVTKLFVENNKTLTKEKIERVKEAVSFSLPFLSKDESLKEVNRRLAIEARDVPVIEKTIRESYMHWKYGQAQKTPSPEDMYAMANLPTETYLKKSFVKVESQSFKEKPRTRLLFEVREKLRGEGLSPREVRERTMNIKTRSQAVVLGAAEGIDPLQEVTKTKAIKVPKKAIEAYKRERGPYADKIRDIVEKREKNQEELFSAEILEEAGF